LLLVLLGVSEELKKKQVGEEKERRRKRAVV